MLKLRKYGWAWLAVILTMTGCNSAPAVPTASLTIQPFPTATPTLSGPPSPSPIATTTAIAVDANSQSVIFMCYDTPQPGFGDQSDFQLCAADPSGANQRVLVDQLRSNVLRSPDGQWLFFALQSQPQVVTNLNRQLYRLKIGETTPIPMAAARDRDYGFGLLNIEGGWLYMRIWDGTADYSRYFRIPLTGGEFQPVGWF